MQWLILYDRTFTILYFVASQELIMPFMSGAYIQMHFRIQYYELKGGDGGANLLHLLKSQN